MALQYVDILSDPLNNNWTNFTLESGFIQDTSSPIAFKYKDGIVYIWGRALSASDQAVDIPSNRILTVATLPSNYKPSRNLRNISIDPDSPNNWVNYDINNNISAYMDFSATAVNGTVYRNKVIPGIIITTNGYIQVGIHGGGYNYSGGTLGYVRDFYIYAQYVL